jgi:hypothetical protein
MYKNYGPKPDKKYFILWKKTCIDLETYITK